MSADRPPVAVAHVRLHTADVERASRFFERLGLRPCMAAHGLAILELRGGTHLLLIEVDDEMQMTLDTVFDLMVDDVEAFRDELRRAGLEVSALSEHARIGHRRFSVVDPDGHRIYVYSDHTEGRVV